MLELKNITKIFDRGTVNEKPVLNDLNLHIKPGEFVTVIGGNGAGKSTLLNIVAGVFTLDSGEVLLNGKNIEKEKEHDRARYFGRVFQDPMMGTVGDMGIEENMALAFRRGKRRGLSWGIKKGERDLFRSHLQRLDLGLEGRMNDKVKLLSGGQRQALTLFMATINKPDLLLLDEHTAALDPKTAKKVLKLTTSLVEEANITTLMITHNMKDAIKYGNRLIMMNDGHIVFDVHGDEKKELRTA